MPGFEGLLSSNTQALPKGDEQDRDRRQGDGDRILGQDPEQQAENNPSSSQDLAAPGNGLVEQESAEPGDPQKQHSQRVTKESPGIRPGLGSQAKKQGSHQCGPIWVTQRPDRGQDAHPRQGGRQDVQQEEGLDEAAAQTPGPGQLAQLPQLIELVRSAGWGRIVLQAEIDM